MNYKVSYKRHLAKTISYRILSTTIGFLGMWWATNSIEIGAAFGVVELLYKSLQYYIHERFWYKYIRFGLISEKKKKQPVSQIKIYEGEPQKTQALTPHTSKSTSKKVMKYSSNR